MTQSVTDFEIKSFETALYHLDENDRKTALKAKKWLEKYIAKIENDDVRRFTVEALSDAPYQFWIEPCSSSGLYHPPEDQGVSGIVRHKIKAAEAGIELSKYFCLDKEEQDYALSAIILHDICKNGEPWGDRTDYRHGLLAAKRLEKYSLGKGKKEIINGVRYHMYMWVEAKFDNEDTPHNVKRANEEELARSMNATPIERVVQLSDFIASRKGVSFMPDIEIVSHKDFCERYG